jgi:Right handed beta helix region
LAVVAAGVVGVKALASSGPGSRRPVAATGPAAAAGGPVLSAPAKPVHVCGNNSVLGQGPSQPPASAVRVPAGVNSSVNFGRPHTTYWFAPGVHTLGGAGYAQIDPAAGAVFVGAPGAVLDGRHKNYYAFADQATDVRISYLTIENFGTNGGNNNEGVVNHDSGTGWRIDHSTIEDNAGAGVMLGSDNTLTFDCLRSNQQYGFNAYSVSGPKNLLLADNEIAGNDTYNWEKRDPGCGCSGGGKFWNVTGATVKDNWVHDNHSVGLWADTDNRGFDFERNVFQANYDVGLVYEISYNAVIQDNVFVRNGFGQGPRNDGFPTGAIYISESGSDPRLPTSYNKTFAITGNLFTDNWSGVILWENANRFCGSPDNSSTTDCTVVDPRVANLRTCTRPDLQRAKPGRTPDYYDLCRWKTQNVDVAHNTFAFNPANIGRDCTAANGCGFVGIFSEWGSDPSWSPFQGQAVEDSITFHQDNHFADNLYIGPWRFLVHQLGTIVSWNAWRGQPYRQDAGSTLRP